MSEDRRANGCRMVVEGGRCGDPATERRDDRTGMTMTLCDEHWAEVTASKRQPSRGLFHRVLAALPFGR